MRISIVIKNPNDIIEPLIADYLKVFGPDLISAILYGSAVSHEYSPGISDINIVLVLSENSIKSISNFIEVHKKWSHKGVAVPLFMTKDYIASSLDTFPIEFLDMQSNYRILYGDDVLSELKIEKGFLRLQCERELKGISLLLRTEYIRAENKSQSLRQLLKLSMRKLTPIFKAILVLNDRKIPSGKSEIISAVEDLFGFGFSAFSDVFHITGNLKDYTDLFNRFAGLVDIVVGYTDQTTDRNSV